LLWNVKLGETSIEMPRQKSLESADRVNTAFSVVYEVVISFFDKITAHARQSIIASAMAASVRAICCEGRGQV